MKFLCLIFGGDCVQEAERSGTAGVFEPAEVYDFVEDLRANGHFVAASPLDHTKVASHLTMRDDSLSVTDGPFVETKEILAGFFMIEVANQHEAEQIMSRAPHARTATIELRALLESKKLKHPAKAWLPVQQPEHSVD